MKEDAGLARKLRAAEWVAPFQTVGKVVLHVIPVETGIQNYLKRLDSRLRGNDEGVQKQPSGFPLARE